MKKNILFVLLSVLLSLGLIAGGLLFMSAYNSRISYYSDAISDAQQTLASLDISAVESSESDLNALLESNDTIAQQIAELEKENAALNEENSSLQQELDVLSQDENTIYYQTILNSLKEGLKQVVQHIEAST